LAEIKLRNPKDVLGYHARQINEQLKNKIAAKVGNKKNWFIWSKGKQFQAQ